MKPLNLDNRPCSPISSNCVVWQGPDISCINICHGDTISDVVAALATELCTLLDQTNVNNYDLACLGITGCGPKDFQALVQLLIDKICELQNIDTVQTPRQPQGTCPDCIVTIASCFRVGNQTTMQLLDYVNMIAEKVCALIDQINNLQIQINSLDVRVTVLENATPPSFTLPSIETNCLASYMSGSVSATIDLVLDTLLNDPIIGYCSLIDSTGLPSELFSAVSSACLTATSPTLSNPPVPFGTEYLGSWVNSPTTVADTITNLWLVVCDIYDYLSNATITVADTNSIDLDLTGGVITANIQDTGWENLEGLTYYGGSTVKPQCRRIGNQIHFRGYIVVPLTDPDSPGVVVPYTSSSAYNGIAGCTTFSGVGGCTLNSNGSITFNNNTSVIPLSILDAPTQFDGSYLKVNHIATRPIDINATDGTSLSATFTVVITSDKKLVIVTLKDQEFTATSASPSNLGTSSLRFITSTIVAGDNVPNYINTSTIHNAPSAAPYNLSTDANIGVWPFTCDAGEETDIGGFAVSLDGLIAYVSPCTTDIKSYVCP